MYASTQKNDKHNYIISEEEQTELEKTTVEKDLGIRMDNELGFKEHIKKIVKKSELNFRQNNKILHIPGQAESSLTM